MWVFDYSFFIFSLFVNDIIFQTKDFLLFLLYTFLQMNIITKQRGFNYEKIYFYFN